MAKPLIGFVLGLLVIPVIAAVVAFTGHLPFEATAKPPMWERRLAGMALDAGIERRAEGKVNPVATSDAELMSGLKIYRDDCAGCHGDRGKPSAWGRNNFYPPAPQLANRGVGDDVPNIYTLVKFGVRYTGMAAWKDQLSEDDLWRVSMFLHSVKTLPASVDSAWNVPAAPEAKD